MADIGSDVISKTGWADAWRTCSTAQRRIEDLTLSSIAGTNTFEVGNTVLPYAISPNGSVGLAGFDGAPMRMCVSRPSGFARVAAKQSL